MHASSALTCLPPPASPSSSKDSGLQGRIEFVFQPTANLDCAETGEPYCGDNGIYLTLAKTNPENPVRNVRLLMPGFEHVYDRQPFHPWFLKSLQRYSAIRFMDWSKTNSDKLPVEWADRTTELHDSQAREGGAALGADPRFFLHLFVEAVNSVWEIAPAFLLGWWDDPLRQFARSAEYMILLCNMVGASPWFTVPHTASDDYVRKMAEMVQARLRPDLQVFLEHSNEVWNTFFPQGRYAQERGLALQLSDDPAVAQYRYHSQRSTEIFRVWASVWGADAVQVCAWMGCACYWVSVCISKGRGLHSRFSHSLCHVGRLVSIA